MSTLTSWVTPKRLANFVTAASLLTTLTTTANTVDNNLAQQEFSMVKIHPFEHPVSMSALAPSEQRVHLGNWRTAPFNRLAFQHERELLTTALISRGDDPVHEFERQPMEIDQIEFRDANEELITIGEYFTRTYADGFLVLKAGRIVNEQYFTGMTPSSTHMAFSVSKSLTVSLLGILIDEGKIDPNATFGRYLPEFNATPEQTEHPYAHAKIQHAMDMSSGVEFPYDYYQQDGFDEFDTTSGWSPGRTDWRKGQLNYILDKRATKADSGKMYDYKDIDTEMLGYLMERVSGKSVAQLFSEKIMRKLGAEEDASLIVDGAGSSVAAGGYSLTLRDLGRWGQMIHNDGEFNGQQIVPASYVAEIKKNYDPNILRGNRYEGVHKSYHNQFWIPYGDPEVLAAMGLFGQHVHIDSARQVVIVKFSSYSRPGEPYFRNTDLRAFAAVTEAVSPAIKALNAEE